MAPRSLRLILGMFALTALLGVAASSQYQTAAPVPLFTRFDGNISVTVTVPEGKGTLDFLMLSIKAFRCAELQTQGMALDEEESVKCGPDTYDFMMTGLARKGAPPCFDYRIDLDGDARLSERREPSCSLGRCHISGRCARSPAKSPHDRLAAGAEVADHLAVRPTCGSP